MKSQDAKELINDLENQVEAHLQEAIRVFQNLSDDELIKPSATSGWSIAQCLWHLNSYGHYYLPQIEKGLTNHFPVNATFKSTWLGNYFTNIMKPGPKMKKFNAFKNHIPPVKLNANEVVAEFIQQQEEILKLLAKSRGSDLNKIRIPISIMRWIKLKLGDVFQFIIAHNERHLVQARRNL